MRLFPALLLIAALPAYAAGDADVNGPVPGMAPDIALPEALQRVQGEGAQIVRSFPAPDGLTGWLVKIQGHYLVVYSTASGDYVISGSLVDKNGKNLSAEYGDRYIPKPDAAKIAAALGPDPWLVEDGVAAAPLIYVYADPNCIYCNKLWNELRPYVQSGKVRVRWALLAFLKPTSKGRAAAILAAHDRDAALAEDELKFDKDHEEGGIAELKPVSPDIDTVLKIHNEQMIDAGGAGTPTLVFKRQDGWAISYGAPKDIAAFIAALVK
ncbi:MAG TPA: thiol:disulfide interchange protein DsbG [Gammaproteobacteria bacterium]|nr:thiol:disulfide interchange protein DsbG [Gammaproteobacteria bacterium]